MERQIRSQSERYELSWVLETPNDHTPIRVPTSYFWEGRYVRGSMKSVQAFAGTDWLMYLCLVMDGYDWGKETDRIGRNDVLI